MLKLHNSAMTTVTSGQEASPRSPAKLDPKRTPGEDDANTTPARLPAKIPSLPTKTPQFLGIHSRIPPWPEPEVFRLDQARLTSEFQEERFGATEFSAIGGQLPIESCEYKSPISGEDRCRPSGPGQTDCGESGGYLARILAAPLCGWASYSATGFEPRGVGHGRGDGQDFDGTIPQQVARVVMAAGPDLGPYDLGISLFEEAPDDRG